MWTRLAFVLLGLAFVGCGDDANDADPDAAIDMGPDMGGACQPSSPHEELLTAPTTAVVVPKTPTHPPVGDGGLP